MNYLSSSHCIRPAAVAVLLAAISGCGATRVGRIGQSEVIATGADQRLVFASKISLDNENRVIPRQVICAEPSPDIAKAVTEAFSGSSALEVRGRGVNTPVEGSLEHVLALSSSKVQAIAQMTERLATIQLLRDGLYRACEAYSNGAITDVTYGMLVSRYDDTMVTMLLAELAAGNFGRSLAAIGGNSSGSSNAAKGAVDKLIEAQKDYEAKRVELEAAEAEKAKVDANADATEQERTTAAEKVDSARKKFDEAKAAQDKEQKQATAIMTASAQSAATATVTAAGAIGRQAASTVRHDEATDDPASSVTRALLEMHRAYLYDINEDALVVACIQALGTDRHIDPAVPPACISMLRESRQFAADLLQFKTEQRYEIDKIKAMGSMFNKDPAVASRLFGRVADRMERSTP